MIHGAGKPGFRAVAGIKLFPPGAELTALIFRQHTEKPLGCGFLPGALRFLSFFIISIGITGINLYQAFGKGYIGPEIHIEEEGKSEHAQDAPAPGDAQARLTELRALYDQRLITQEEYEQKRREILEEL